MEIQLSNFKIWKGKCLNILGIVSYSVQVVIMIFCQSIYIWKLGSKMQWVQVCFRDLFGGYYFSF